MIWGVYSKYGGQDILHSKGHYWFENPILARIVHWSKGTKQIVLTACISMEMMSGWF